MKKTFGNVLQYIKNKPYTHFIFLGLVFTFIQIMAMPGIKIFPSSFARGFGEFMIHIIIVLGYYILLGYAGLASLGTAGFVGLGTYITGFFLAHTQIPLLLIVIVCILVGVLLGLIVGFISLRIEGMYLAIITLGLSEILLVIFKNFEAFTGGVSGLNVYGKGTILFGLIKLSRENAYFIIVAALVGLMVLTYNLIKSPLGRAMLSMKNSESAAQTMGVSLLKYRLLAFVIASVYAMIAGFLYMIYYKYSEPTKWTLNLSLNVLASVVIGGTGSIWGILLGTYLVFSLNSTLLGNIAYFQDNPSAFIFLTGVLMIIVVMFYPGGISQLLLTVKYRLKVMTNRISEKKKKKVLMAKEENQ